MCGFLSMDNMIGASATWERAVGLDFVFSIPERLETAQAKAIEKPVFLRSTDKTINERKDRR
jgi:hypothetical protein